MVLKKHMKKSPHLPREHCVRVTGISCDRNKEHQKIIIRHNSRAKIIARDYAILTVDVLDNAQVEIEELDNAKIKIYRK